MTVTSSRLAGGEIMNQFIRAPGRPGRQMAPLWDVAQYWAVRDTFDMTLNWPHCFACFREAPGGDDLTVEERWHRAGLHLDRAHLVTRIFYGLDGPQNLVPLCHRCHRVMPHFRGYDEFPDPILWVQRGGWRFELLEWAT